MKKILFITTRNPFSDNFSGDRLRSSSILDFLSKKNQVDLLYIDKKKNNEILKGKFRGNKFFFEHNMLQSFLNFFFNFFKFNSLQSNYFYSNEAHKFVNNNQFKYDVIIFHLIRSANLLPSGFTGKTILEMTDVYSDNYKQTVKKLSIFNPLLYLYLIESFLIKRQEKICSLIFDKVVLVENQNIKKLKHLQKKKIIKINNGCSSKKKVFKFNKKNNKILFVGNIKYLPNKEACFYFAKNILPKLVIEYPEIEFCIVGEISLFNKIFLNSYKNVKALGPKKNLSQEIRRSICGIANLNIATGMQNKILTYMSYGLPSIISENSFSNIFSKNKDLLVYNSDIKLFELICRLKENKTLANKISNNGYSKIKKNFSWSRVLNKYNQII